MELDDFTMGYIDCALWSSTDDDGDPMDRLYSRGSIDDDCMAKMIADCIRFQAMCPALLETYCEQITPREGTAMSYAGHDFWLTRNGHGAGFWDRDGLDEKIGEALTVASNRFGEFNLHISDEGKVCAE